MKPNAFFALLFVSSYAGAQEVSPAVLAAREFREEYGSAILRSFAELLRVPNVASDRVNIRRNAEWISELFAQRGVEMELWNQEGAPPIVYGRLDSNAGDPAQAPTYGIYVHYDGQPVASDEWTNPPWEPVLYTREYHAGGVRRDWPSSGETIDPEWRIYARAAGDDKAPLPALLTALDALSKAGIARTANIVFFFEGEEEVGSPHLEAYLDAHHERLDVDAWFICDGPVHQSRRPQLVFGVRGITSFELTVYGATRGLHSGHYGNWAPNPGEMLARLLSSMKDASGKVLVEGFYDTVTPLGAAERQALAEIPEVDQALMREFGLARTEADGKLSARLLLPSLNIRGLTSGRTGAEARNVIPGTAVASMDVRLVRGNEPAHMLDLIEAHIAAQGYHIVRDEPDLDTRLAHPRIARIRRGGGYVAARASMDHPVVGPLVKAATMAAGTAPVMVPSLGGSLPLYLFTKYDNVPVIVVPIANHDNNQHAPDENLRIANLWYGIDLFTALLTMEPHR